MRGTKKNYKPTPESEALCRRCGRCCFLKIPYKDKTYVTPFPCRHLNLQTRLCSIYGERLEKHPRCLPATDAIRKSALPPDCPYVANKSNYVPPIEHWDDEAIEFFVKEFQKLMPAIVDELRAFVQTHPNEIVPLFRSAPPEDFNKITWEYVTEKLRLWLQQSPYDQLYENKNVPTEHDSK